MTRKRNFNYGSQENRSIMENIGRLREENDPNKEIKEKAAEIATALARNLELDVLIEALKEQTKTDSRGNYIEKRKFAKIVPGQPHMRHRHARVKTVTERYIPGIIIKGKFVECSEEIVKGAQMVLTYQKVTVDIID